MQYISVKDFMIDYFKKIDFDYWQKRVDMNTDKLRRLKTFKAKSPYIIDFYAMYIQLLEIFFINVLMLTSREKGFLDLLFINNKQLRELIKTNFDNKAFIRIFLDNFVFGMKEKENINNFQEKYRQHINILEEFYDDYLHDYDFLNSYKHGYRVHASHEAAIGINGVAIITADTALTYFQRIGKTIFEINLMFNHQRVGAKIYFLLYMLKNSQKVFLSQELTPGRQINFEHIYIQDYQAWNKSFGKARTKIPLFEMK